MHAWPQSSNRDDTNRPKPNRGQSSAYDERGGLMNGHARSGSESQHIHDANAFELQGLISDEEGDEQGAGHARVSMDPKREGDEESDPVGGKETQPH